MENKSIKGYKVFNPDFTCRNFKFEVGQTYTLVGNPIICENGFHFCLKAGDCFSYYSFEPNNIVCEVEALGEVVGHTDDSKQATNILKVIRKLEWAEVLTIANSGLNNTGHSNSGNSNSGNRNSGNSNSGYRNNGYRNSGNSNSGDWNSGNWNSGDSNSGDWNSGDWNSGYRNSGNRNSGYSNSGNSNSGNSNSGNWNSGNSNSGDWNSGNWNSGDRNSGNSNSGYRNSGAFCLNDNPILYLFDKPTKTTVREWESSKPVRIMNEFLNQCIWVQNNIMTEEEKAANPNWETTNGYLKTITLKEAWSNMWNNLSEENKQEFLTLENFNAESFESITGIKTN